MSLLLALALMIAVFAWGGCDRAGRQHVFRPESGRRRGAQAICGVSVVLAEEKGDWVKVRTPDDYPGWMLLAALRRYGPRSHVRFHRNRCGSG